MRRKETIKNKQGIVSGPDYRDLGAILLFIFLLPYIVSFFFGKVGREAIAAGKGAEEEINSTGILVCNTTAAGTETMPLETYLVSRLPSVIDMGYEEEALKAQVIVLRTELMRSGYDRRDAPIPEDGRPTGSGDTGKTYIYTKHDIMRADGEVYERAKKAADDTRGMYMTYEGLPIKAPYFAVSAGATRNGNEVFNSEDYKYLKSVMCERDFTSEAYNRSVRMGRRTFFDKLNEISPGISTAKNKELNELLCISRDRAGYVAEIGIGDTYISGEAFRDLFLLSSSCFEICEERDEVCIKTKGVGHGVGFCQYAANEAAKKGSDYIDILNYFFSDIVIEKTE